jgi:hypothetical protein
LELELNIAITFDVQLKAQETKELHRSSRTHHAPIRYGLLMKAKNDKLLILYELTNYMEKVDTLCTNEI